MDVNRISISAGYWDFWGLMGLKNGAEWDYGICIKGINGT